VFPPVVLSLAVQMHLAPRVLQASGACSSGTQVNCSILAGCINSVPFAKSLLHSFVEAAISAHPGVKVGAFVDDLAQNVQGSIVHVLNELVDSGKLLVSLLRKLRLRISPKSMVVCSNKYIAKHVAARLGAAGIEVRHEASARDLGVSYTAGKRRVATLQNARLVKAGKRSLRIASMAKATKQARRLFTTGARPQAIWGHQVHGVAAGQMTRLRTMAARASGLFRTGRCTTTAIAPAYGEFGDPAIVCTAEVVKTWCQYWVDNPEAHENICMVWDSCCADIVKDGLEAWRKSGDILAP
jgi:hypothetical protein